MRTFRILFTWLAIMGALSAAQVGAEHAAAIDYDFVERPANVSPDFQAPAGTSLRFVNIKAIDGFRVEAALWQPEDKPPTATTVLVGVHGSGSNFTAPPIGAISPLLAANGYAVLSISTRQHDKLQNTENFFDVRRDIEAAVFTARALGYLRKPNFATSSISPKCAGASSAIIRSSNRRSGSTTTRAAAGAASIITPHCASRLTAS